jgi:hypothetical protein
MQLLQTWWIGMKVMGCAQPCHWSVYVGCACRCGDGSASVRPSFLTPSLPLYFSFLFSCIGFILELDYTTLNTPRLPVVSGRPSALMSSLYIQVTAADLTLTARTHARLDRILLTLGADPESRPDNWPTAVLGATTGEHFPFPEGGISCGRAR